MLKIVRLTPEEKVSFEGCYIISAGEIAALGDPKDTTAENFRAFVYSHHYSDVLMLTAQDFEFDDELDFVYLPEELAISKEYAPKEVVAILEEALLSDDK